MAANDNKIRLREALQFLINNPQEKKATAARIYKVNEHTLSSAFDHINQYTIPRGRQNKILSELQNRAIIGFIRSYLEHNQAPTREVIFYIICQMRQSDQLDPPS